MIFGFEQPFDFHQRGSLKMLDGFSDYWNPDSQKYVAVSVLPLGCFKESLRELSNLRIGKFPQVRNEFLMSQNLSFVEIRRLTKLRVKMFYRSTKYCHLFPSIFAMNTFRRGRMHGNTHTRSVFLLWTYWSGDEPTATIRTNIVKQLFHTISAKGTFVSADTGLP